MTDDHSAEVILMMNDVSSAVSLGGSRWIAPRFFVSATLNASRTRLGMVSDETIWLVSVFHNWSHHIRQRRGFSRMQVKLPTAKQIITVNRNVQTEPVTNQSDIDKE